MCYLTQLTINHEHPAAVRVLADSHALHRLVYLGFPDADEGGAGRPLYRLELPTRARRTTRILLQSSHEPAHLDRWHGTGYLSIQGPKPGFTSFRDGQILRFRLRANPTVCRSFSTTPGEAGRVSGKRVGLYAEEDQRAWLDRKGKDAGFEVLRLDLAPPRPSDPDLVQDAVLHGHLVLGRKPGWHCDRSDHRDEPRKLIHLAVTFDGLLRVQDSPALLSAVAAGIGPAKAFGFGLLSLAPA